VNDLCSLVRQICTKNAAIGEVSVRISVNHYGFNVQRARVCARLDETVGHFVTQNNYALGVLAIHCPLFS
jgi:hypothetical protein